MIRSIAAISDSYLKDSSPAEDKTLGDRPRSQDCSIPVAVNLERQVSLGSRARTGGGLRVTQIIIDIMHKSTAAAQPLRTNIENDLHKLLRETAKATLEPVRDHDTRYVRPKNPRELTLLGNYMR